MIKPQAYFDGLAVCHYLQAPVGPVAKAEVHLFAYLGCLLSLYRKRPATEWGYRFAVTPEGYPFSAELRSAIDRLLANGHLIADCNRYLSISSRGSSEYEALKSLSLLSQREPYIEGASGSVLTLPIGSIRTALAQEAQLQNALELEQPRLLLSEFGSETLYRQFGELSNAVGVNVSDLMVPAVIWLTYLGQTGGSKLTSAK